MIYCPPTPSLLAPWLQILALAVLIAVSIALSDLDGNYRDLDVMYPQLHWDWNRATNLSRDACGFLVFFAIIIMAVEVLIIALRFLNVEMMKLHNKAFLIAVSVELFYKQYVDHTTCICETVNSDHHLLGYDIVA